MRFIRKMRPCTLLHHARAASPQEFLGIPRMSNAPLPKSGPRQQAPPRTEVPFGTRESWITLVKLPAELGPVSPRKSRDTSQPYKPNPIGHPSPCLRKSNHKTLPEVRVRISPMSRKK